MLLFSRLPLACFQDSRWLVCPVSIKVIWRGSRTSKSPTECTDYVGFSQIYSLFMTLGLILGRSGIFVENNASKCHFFGSIWSPFLLRGLKWRCFWGGRDFSGSIFNFLPFLCEKCPFFEIPMFAWKSWSILLPRLRAFCARIWNWFKTVFPTSTVFKKMPWKWKCCFLYS